MQVHEIMTRDVRLASPSDKLRDAAELMRDIDAGMLPVGENDRLVGMVSDRDLVVRGLAEGKGPENTVRDVMSRDVKYVYEDETVEDVERNMSGLQVKRLPVLSRDKRLVGIVSLGDLATRAAGDGRAGAALAGISRGA
jgi:CBS domain-containing protein